MPMRLLTMCLLLAGAARAQDAAATTVERFRKQEEAAFEAYNREAWDEAIAAFEKQIAIFSDNPRPYYNIACCYGLQSDGERAATWLRVAVQRGWRDLKHVKRDLDLDLVRQHKDFKDAVAFLRRVKESDPEPVPRPVAAVDSEPAASFQDAILEETFEEEALRRQRPLLEPGQWRRRIFPVLDRQLGRLTRYLIENGDARDAARAAHARVQTAMRYLIGTTVEDGDLREVAAKLVLRMAREFLFGWPGTPELADVLVWRGYARNVLGDTKDARSDWTTVVKDHPGTSAAMRATRQLQLSVR